jgi:hypothetical protein
MHLRALHVRRWVVLNLCIRDVSGRIPARLRSRRRFVIPLSHEDLRFTEKHVIDPIHFDNASVFKRRR